MPDGGNSLCKGQEVTATAAQQTDQRAAREEAEDKGRGHIRPFPSVLVLELCQTEREPQQPAESSPLVPEGGRGQRTSRSTEGSLKKPPDDPVMRPSPRLRVRALHDSRAHF